MTFHSLLIHTLTIRNPIDDHDPDHADRYGNEPDGYDAGVVAIGRFDERGGSENDIDQDTRRKQYLLFLEATAPISALSILAWDGRELRVDGEPDMKNDSSGPHHWEVQCEELLG